MIRHAVRVGGLTLASRVVGFVRDVLTAQFLGAGPVADAFFVAFRIPNHFRTIFAEGAFNAAFVPSYAALREREGTVRARRFAEDVLALMLGSQVVLLILALLFMPGFVRLLAPGFADEPIRFELAVLFSRITFGYLLCIALVTLFGGILNAENRFSAAAGAPILLNLCLIAALLATRWLPSAGHALAWGVLAAGIAQLLLLVVATARQRISLRLRRPRLTGDVRIFLRRLGPAVFGSGAVQIGLFADTIIASFLPAGAISYLYYADRLNQLPLGVIGIAIGTVLLPDLSRRVAAGDEGAAIQAQKRALASSLALTLPCAIGLGLLAEPLMVGLFMRGAFDRAAAHGAAQALMAYAVGLPAFVLVRSLTPGFQGRGDTGTPVRLALIATGFNIALKLLLIGPLSYVGVALGTSLASWLNAGLLAIALRRRGWLALDPEIKGVFRRCAGAGLIMAGTVLMLRGIGPWLWTPTGSTGVALAEALGIGGIGVLAYSIALYVGRDRDGTDNLLTLPIRRRRAPDV